ncbi:MAG: serine protease [Candidatus Saccharimonadales bacterium]|jgi:serine protease
MLQKFSQLFLSLFIAIISSTPLLSTPVNALETLSPAADFSDGYSTRSLDIKFVPNSGVLDENGNISGNEDELLELSAILGRNNIKSSEKLFIQKTGQKVSDQEKARVSTGNPLPNIDNYATIKLKNNVNMNSVIRELEDLDFIASAFPKMLPTALPTVSPDYDYLQTHLRADIGTNADFVHQIDGGLGENVRIVDLEYSWNIDHEDLGSIDASDQSFVGDYVNPFNDDYHGTAVASLLVGDHNDIGVNGIAPDADLKLVNTYSDDYGFDLARSIYSALDIMSAGDIMLIEHQANGPLPGLYDYVPVEYIPSVYDAISYATSLGIIVIEPAGNGDQNLDDTSLFGNTFQKSINDSGAIMVGASDGCNIQNPGTRHHQSNYGSRIDLYAEGQCVAAAGYGYLHSSSGEDAYYTNSFGGTSAASAIVAGNAALLSSAAQETGNLMTPSEILAAFTSTGSLQDPASAGNIGKKPQTRGAIFADNTVLLTSCYSGGYGQQFFLHVSKNYFQNPSLPDAQKHAAELIGNSYSSKSGSEPVSFSQDGDNCHTSSYDDVSMQKVEHTARYTELSLSSSQAYSGVLLGYLIIFWGL